MAEARKKPAAAKKPRTTATVAAPAGTAKAVAPAAAKKRTTKPRAAATPLRVTYGDIAALAHRYFAERGYAHGHDAEDWLRAEASLLGKAS